MTLLIVPIKGIIYVLITYYVPRSSKQGSRFEVVDVRFLNSRLSPKTTDLRKPQAPDANTCTLNPKTCAPACPNLLQGSGLHA